MYKFSKRIISSLMCLFLVTTFVVTVSACGEEESASSANTFCAVSDSGGWNDKSFNQSVRLGVEQAVTDLGVQKNLAESKNENDYDANLKNQVGECGLIFTVGFNLADATTKFAKENTDQNFAIIDDSSIDLPNVKPIVFNTAEASYLAGYLAAGMSETGTVATFGGMAIPTVQIFSDGFYQGVQKYNEDNSKSVKVLGWNPDDPNSSSYVAQDATGFTDQTKGKSITKDFIAKGADVILPVAGQAGIGAAAAVKDANANVSAANDKAKLIWVDADGYETQPDYKEYILSSVMKEIKQATFDNIKAVKEGSFSNTPYIGTIANKGVGLAPFHDFESMVEGQGDLKAKLDKLQEDIASGTIKVESKFSPSAS